MLSLIAIIALAWVCRKKTKKTEHETLMLTSFEPGFEVGYADEIPEEHWQEYDDDESDYETSDESDVGTIFESTFGEEARSQNHDLKTQS